MNKRYPYLISGDLKDISIISGISYDKVKQTCSGNRKKDIRVEEILYTLNEKRKVESQKLAELVAASIIEKAQTNKNKD